LYPLVSFNKIQILIQIQKQRKRHWHAYTDTDTKIETNLRRGLLVKSWAVLLMVSFRTAVQDPVSPLADFICGDISSCTN